MVIIERKNERNHKTGIEAAVPSKCDGSGRQKVTGQNHLKRNCSGMQKAIEEDGAEVLVMGCTGIVGIDDEMKEKLLADGYDVPVLEAGACAMTMAELYARMGLKPGRITYMDPPLK